MWRRHSYYWLIPTMLLAAGVAQAQTRNEPLIDPGRIIGGSTKQLQDVQLVRGFLPQPALLRPGGAGQAALVYLNPSADFSSYTKIMLEAVTIWTTPDSPLNRVPQSQRRALAQKFYADTYNALRQHCQMVRSPSPGTMRIRIALTDATSPDAAVNTVATFAPYVSAAYGVASSLFNKGVGYFAGTASAEAFAIDATKGTVLWEAADKRGGTTALVANTLDNWRDVNHAMEAWSQKLAARLLDLGACRQ
ncbi:MAG: DUF3313 domain-containing protein [Alphaproteobacteria bacterium]|nr:DUF3313 domain-containing protein [Alphaproteobacteria bacterium]